MKTSFRPLTGTLLSKLYRIYELTDEAKSFRPLTGTLLSKRESFLLCSRHDCFRPLTGTLLSKHHPPILPPQAAFFAGLRGK